MNDANNSIGNDPARTTPRISGRLIAAARALVGVSREDFAAGCGLPVDSLILLESLGSSLVQDAAQVEAVARGLDHFGVVVIEDSGTMGAGVRLKFNREDVRQIARLEGEGGMIGCDDAP